MPPPLELTFSLGLRSGGQQWGSERRMALLAAIQSEGSIRAAAQQVGMSYKAAWDAIALMNRASGQVLVQRTTGGAGGGGARLTKEARDLLAWFQALQEAQQHIMQRLAQNGQLAHDHLDLLQNLPLMTSARNRFAGTVVRVDALDPVNHLIHLALGDGPLLLAVITRASTERLGLQPGVRALAIIKAQAVRIRAAPATGRVQKGAGHLPEPDSPDRVQEPPWNQWPGQAEYHEGRSGVVEARLDAGGGVHITGLGKASPDTPALQAGQPAVASFPARDVLLATPDLHPHKRGENVVF
ncbi:TOBE domain-containing protein [Castellaniella sp.]|uniref:TOBE domain-containing protein n=1 Tax=Castellaniella sp. TaxID=1955812 RepID=UPI00355F8719